jgi:hypothetical protein
MYQQLNYLRSVIEEWTPKTNEDADKKIEILIEVDEALKSFEDAVYQMGEMKGDFDRTYQEFMR